MDLDQVIRDLQEIRAQVGNVPVDVVASTAVVEIEEECITVSLNPYDCRVKIRGADHELVHK